MAIAFCIDILFMKPDYTFPGLLIVLIGIPVYYYWKSKQLPAVPEPEVTALNS